MRRLLFLWRVWLLWRRWPELRFGQFLSNAYMPADPYYWSDVTFLSRLERFCEDYGRKTRWVA